MLGLLIKEVPDTNVEALDVVVAPAVDHQLGACKDLQDHYTHRPVVSGKAVLVHPVQILEMV